MFGTQHLALFTVSGILLNLTPGQDTLYIVGRSVSQGRRAGLLSVTRHRVGLCDSYFCGRPWFVGRCWRPPRMRLRRQDRGRRVSRVPRPQVVVGACPTCRRGSRFYSRERLGDIQGRIAHQPSQPEGRFVLHGVPATVRCARRATRASCPFSFLVRCSWSTARYGA